MGDGEEGEAAYVEVSSVRGEITLILPLFSFKCLRERERERERERKKDLFLYKKRSSPLRVSRRRTRK